VGNSDRRLDRYSLVVHMSEFIWCHGTSCHKSSTQDRVRGSKGSKVLRTRKVKQHTNSEWYHRDQIYNYFCSQTCLHNFIKTHLQRIVALDPRTEPKETPINDPERSDNYYRSWNITERGVDTSTE
jgi:YHS domain-containing protein